MTACHPGALASAAPVIDYMSIRVDQVPPTRSRAANRDSDCGNVVPVETTDWFPQGLGNLADSEIPTFPQPFLISWTAGEKHHRCGVACEDEGQVGADGMPRLRTIS